MLQELGIKTIDDIKKLSLAKSVSYLDKKDELRAIGPVFIFFFDSFMIAQSKKNKSVKLINTRRIREIDMDQESGEFIVNMTVLRTLGVAPPEDKSFA